MTLGGFDIPEERIFTDKQSAKDFNRPAYRKLKAGDMLIVRTSTGWIMRYLNM